MLTVSAEARVIASFTLVATLVLGGWGQLSGLGRELFGGYSPGDTGPEVTATVGILLVAAAAAAVAQRSVAGAEAVWAKHLAGATVILTGLVGVAGLLHIINVAF